MNKVVMRTRAFKEFEKHFVVLKDAVNQEDYQKQLVALSQAIDALQDARKATAGLAGGLLQ